MNSQKKNKPIYSFKNIKRDSSERFLILGVSEYRRWIPRKSNKILGLFKWDTSIPWQSSFSFHSLWCGYIWTQSLFCSENRNNHIDGIKNLMEMMKNQNQTGNRMFDVVYGKCSKEVSNDRQVVNLPFTNTLTPSVIPQGWKLRCRIGI